MDTQQRLATSQWILERTLGWIAAAEVKVGVLLTIDIAMLGGLAAAYSAVTNKTDFEYGFTVSTAALSFVAAACGAMCIKPRTDGPKHSLVFFGPITDMSSADYSDRFRLASDSELLADITEQIHRNAQIASIKHKWVQRATAWSFLSAATWAVSVGLLVRR
jgi:hypothetical protein